MAATMRVFVANSPIVVLHSRQEEMNPGQVATKGSLSSEWNQYVGCVLLHMVLPLLPLLIEIVLFEHGPKNTSLTLTLALYAMAIGLTSINFGIFCGCILLSLVSSIFFGVLSAQEAMTRPAVVSAAEAVSGQPFLHGPSPLDWMGVFVSVCLAAVFFTHLAERYFRHIVDCKKFFEFGV